MIRESLYFSFDGIKSTNFPIVNIKVDDGLYNESVSTAKTINESYPRGAFKPYFFGVQKQPKEFDLAFAFLEPWNDQLIDEVIRWLNVDDYRKLFFEADIDRVIYAMPVTDINVMHNGLKQGYLVLTVRCDSAYSYSHTKMTPTYNMLEVDEERDEDIINLGHFDMYPDIEIAKVGDGDLSIFNMSDGNKEFKFTDLKDGERIYVDCMNEIIETSLEDTNRYDNFNDEYLTLIYGKNRLKIKGSCRIRFIYQYIFS